MKVVVISAHPDDMEIGCGGTLQQLHRQGADILSIVTVRPSAEVHAARDRDTVTKELVESYGKSGWAWKLFETDLHENGRPNLVCNNITMTALARHIDTADLAIIPNPQDSHQDHRITHDLVWPIVQRRAKEVWIMHSWPYCYHYKHNSANMFVGIDWAFKHSLLQCYSSYLSDSDIEKIKTVNAMWGHKSGNTHAEAFELAYKYVQ